MAKYMLFAAAVAAGCATGLATPAIETSLTAEFQDKVKMAQLYAMMIPDVKAGCDFADPFKTACQPNEVNITIQGVPGSICTPPCENGACPMTPCSGILAKPQCALQDQSGNKYCALLCSPGSNTTQCSHDEHMGCQAISGTGVCTYFS